MFVRGSRVRGILLASCGLLGLACESGDPLAALKPGLSAAPTALAFGDVPLGATRRVPLVLSSIGTGAVRVSRIESDAAFVVLPAVTATLAPGTTLAVSIGFRPQATGEVRATVRVVSDDPRGAVAIELTGRGVDADVVVSPETVELGTVPVGALARTALTATRLGEGALTAGVALEAPRAEHFAVAPSSLALDAARVATIDLRYTPIAAGVDDGVLRVLTCGADCGVEVPVRARALDAGLRANPTVIDFGARAPGSTTLLPLVLSNVADRPVVVRGIELRGPTTLTSRSAAPLPLTIGPNATASVEVSWSPTDASPLDGTIAITTDLEALPNLLVPVRGFVEVGALEVTPEVIDFGVVRVGRTGLRRPFLLANGGRGSVRVTALSLAGAPGIRLGAELTTPLTLSSGESITGSIELDPLPEGARTATLSIESDSVGSPRVALPVRVTASDSACDFTLEPSRAYLGYAPVGVLRRGVLTLRNRGAAACTIDRLALRSTSAPEVSLVDPPALPLTLAPAATATVGVTVLGSGLETYRADVDASSVGTVRTSARAVVLASGVPRGRCLFIEPVDVDLGQIRVGPTQGAVIRAQNIGAEPCSITRVTRTSGSTSWTVVPVPSGLVTPGQVLQLPIEVRTLTPEVAEATVRIETDDPLLPSVDVRLRAVSLDPQLCVDPPSLDFPSSMGMSEQRLAIRACGQSPVDLIDVDWSTTDTELSLVQRVPPQTLQPGQRVEAIVRFTPSDTLPDIARLRIRSTDVGTPRREVAVTTGAAIVPTAAGRSLYFWRIDGSASDIARLSLQGPPAPRAVEGPSAGGSCVGCHAVSKDGRYLGMIALVGAMQIVVRDTQSGNLITPPIPSAHGLSFEPVLGSTRIAYADAAGRVALTDVFGGPGVELARGASRSPGRAGPSWGADGFVYFADINGAIRRVAATGGVDQIVLGTEPALPEENVFPAVSPGGQWLAFTRQGVLGSSVAIVPTSGPGFPLSTQTINQLSSEVSYPTWSVDGRFLSFAARRARSNYDLFLVPFDPQTGMISPPTVIPGGDTFAFEHGAVWSP